MPQDPSFTDSATVLWRKISQNYYEQAVAAGFTENIEPSGTDDIISSMRKVCTYTAFLA